MEEPIFNSPFPIERWTKLTLTKLKKGYVLIVGERSSMLFMKGKGYEPCPTPVARLLVKEGLVELAGSNNRGIRYQLVAGDQPVRLPVFAREDDEDEGNDEKYGADDAEEFTDDDDEDVEDVEEGVDEDV